MSRVLKKITDYQRDRYQQQTKLLSRMESTIKSFRIDDPELGCEQVKLNLSLDQLIKSMDTVKERTQPHKKLRSDVERLRHALLQSLTTRGTNGRAPAKFGSYREYVFDGTVQSIKSEIRSVKGMLLSRHNFPIVTTSSTFAASNIPPAPTVPATNAYHPRRRNRINDFSTKLEDLC